ncbi:helix-turn-helix transcriptional regulator [Roseibium sp. HPY-6]|uniref:helix-turn-helix transcriptional regulator n=1 Tax=Roseibium sp. HPY-6 TaxID=3229852 RepID=UPI003390323D
MEILEALYDCIETNLRGNKVDWQKFANEFQIIHRSELALYRAVYSEDEQKQMDRLDVIATSNAPLLKKYVQKGMHKLHPYPETEMVMLEPIRRTDELPDDDVFRKMGPLTDFLIENGMFYFMNVPAMMPDGHFVCIHVWRDENQGDFSNLEKQRLALMMRHLLATVGESELTLTDPNSEVAAFGQMHGLTTAETTILALLIEGHSLRTISQKSGRTYGTVRWHVQNILEKCQVKSQLNLLSEFYRLMKK